MDSDEHRANEFKIPCEQKRTTSAVCANCLEYAIQMIRTNLNTQKTMSWRQLHCLLMRNWMKYTITIMIAKNVWFWARNDNNSRRLFKNKCAPTISMSFEMQLFFFLSNIIDWLLPLCQHRTYALRLTRERPAWSGANWTRQENKPLRWQWQTNTWICHQNHTCKWWRMKCLNKWRVSCLISNRNKTLTIAVLPTGPHNREKKIFVLPCFCIKRFHVLNASRAMGWDLLPSRQCSSHK